MIKFIPNKRVNFKLVKELFKQTIITNQFTNYGPAVKKLEIKLREICEINENKAVIVTNNGASALHALCLSLKVDKFTTRAFTFPCSVQGPLSNSKIIDLKDIVDDSEYLIDTNLFGHICVDYSIKNLICDNATTTMTKYKGVNVNNFSNSIISLHHTKPLGFGEGGAIICDRNLEEEIRRIINFGFDQDRNYSSYGNNYKMSDVSAVYILAHLENHMKIYSKHIQLYEYFIDKYKAFFPIYDEIPFANTIPVLSQKNLLEIFNSKGIEAKKYYKPLKNLPNSSNLYDKIVCLPLHHQLSFRDIDKYIEILKKS